MIGRRAFRTTAAGLLAALLAGCATLPQRAPVQPQIAITIDDLPVHAPLPPGTDAVAVNREMIAALKAARVPAYAVINGANAGQPKIDVLQEWTAAGMQLGNHGWAHRHLSEMSVDEFEQELIRNEPLLRRAGGDWRWFRYPFLDEGKDAEQRAAARRVLARHGYKIAAVTLDTWDWQWTAPYARCSAAGDKRAIAELERMYLDAAKESIAVARETARELHGRDIPYVQLMHVSAMSARMMPRLLRLYRDEGFRFVSLPEAQRDPTYRAYTDPSEPAPLSVWEIAERKGVKLPQATDYSAKLAMMCVGGDAASTPSP
ncbi:MAG TPA: polysaccharide deacetylase family protein [Sphingomicrobium sp.]|nr:polysaccharide deacetylase family protein [Sphingomicrobium sp.]